MAYVRAAMDWTLERHSPFPAIAFDKHWRLLRTNSTAAALLEPMNICEGDSLLDAFAAGGAIADAIDNWGRGCTPYDCATAYRKRAPGW